MNMREVTLQVVVPVSDNATDEEVRRAVSRCLGDALAIYADAEQGIPHRNTGNLVPTFEYDMPRVDLTTGAEVAILRDALAAFRITQRPEDYPQDHWANRARALLEGV